MSIYTEEAERRFKTACRECGELGIGNFHKCAPAQGTFEQGRIVAECWTCGHPHHGENEYPEPLTNVKTGEPVPCDCEGIDVRTREDK